MRGNQFANVENEEIKLNLLYKLQITEELKS